MIQPQAYISAASITLTDDESGSLLKERKRMKYLSTANLPAVATLERLYSKVKHLCDPIPAYQKAVFIGAPYASNLEQKNYFHLHEKALTQDQDAAQSFGALAMQAQPYTLLQGLPNNILAHASQIFKAQGPNSNYIAMHNSGLCALTRACQVLKWQQAQCALVGASARITDPIVTQMYRQRHWQPLSQSVSCFYLLCPFQATNETENYLSQEHSISIIATHHQMFDDLKPQNVMGALKVLAQKAQIDLSCIDHHVVNFADDKKRSSLLVDQLKDLLDSQYTTVTVGQLKTGEASGLIDLLRFDQKLSLELGLQPMNTTARIFTTIVLNPLGHFSTILAQRG